MHTSTYQTGAYRPKLSWAVALFGIVSIGFLLAAVIILLWSGLPFLQVAVSVAALLGMALYVIDVVFFTRYQLGEEGIVVSGQLRLLAIPYADIRKVRHGSALSLVSVFGHKRHALSPHCVVVELSQGPYRTVSLSPSQDRAFLNSLMHNLELTGRLRRQEDGVANVR